MLADHSEPKVPMAKIIANELEILGSHGMQAFRYADMLGMIKRGQLAPEKLISRTISLEESLEVLVNMNSFSETGVAVIDQF